MAVVVVVVVVVVGMLISSMMVVVEPVDFAHRKRVKPYSWDACFSNRLLLRKVMPRQIRLVVVVAGFPHARASDPVSVLQSRTLVWGVARVLAAFSQIDASGALFLLLN